MDKKLTIKNVVRIADKPISHINGKNWYVSDVDEIDDYYIFVLGNKFGDRIIVKLNRVGYIPQDCHSLAYDLEFDVGSKGFIYHSRLKDMNTLMHSFHYTIESNKI